MSIIKGKSKRLALQKKAEDLALRLKENQFATWEEVHDVLYPFILCKYSLDGLCENEYDLDTLAQLSVAETIKLTKTDAFYADSKASCEGTTSAMNKKVLLLMAIQKTLNIQFPREITADLTDTKKIAKAVWTLLQEQ